MTTFQNLRLQFSRTSFLLLISLSFCLLGLIKASAYGGGSGGGSGGGAVNPGCSGLKTPSITSLNPGVNAIVTDFNDLSFEVSGSLLGRDNILVEIQDEEISLNISEISSSGSVTTYLVRGSIAQNFADDQRVKIFIEANGDNGRCSSQRVYFIAVNKQGGVDPVDPTDPTDPTDPGNPGNPFVDVNDPILTDLYNNYCIEGYQSSAGVLFQPNELVNRAEFVRMALCMFNEPSPGFVTINPFPDVPASKWYARFVHQAKKLGWVNGYRDGLFKPINNVSKAETLKVAMKAGNIVENLQPDLPKGVLVGITSTFNDVPEYAWYYGYAGWAAQNCFGEDINGAQFNPERSLSRAETVDYILRIQSCINWSEEITLNPEQTANIP
jgi:hypothetical protein